MKRLIIASILLLLCIPAMANTKVPAKDLSVDTSGFNRNLTSADNTVQHALSTIDQFAITGGGVSGLTAGRVPVAQSSTLIADSIIYQSGSYIGVNGNVYATAYYGDGSHLSGVSTSSAWGGITGTLSNQTDLQNALNAKQNSITTGTTSQYFRGDLTLATFPTVVSSFTNDAGYMTSSGSYTPNGTWNWTSASVTWPTFNQNTTGSAAKLTTARTINGVSFDGTSNITVVDATKEPTITSGTTAQYWRGDKSWQTLDKTSVGLGSVENAAASGLYVPLTRTVNGQALSGNVTVTTITGNAGTATALASAPTTCPAGYYARGIDVNGNAVNCSADQTGGGGSISGLSAGKVPYATSSTTIADSNIYTNGTNIGIGTTTAPTLLTVGVNPTITSGSTPAVAVKGNLMVDGKIYGDGSTLTGIPSGTITSSTATNLTGILRGNGALVSADTTIYQTSSSILNALSGLSYSSPGNVRMNGASSFTVDQTVYLTPTGSAASLTNFPTLNQNTTGSAAKWTTARTLAGNSVDGTANVSFSNKFIVQGTTDSGLSGAQFLGSLGTGILKNTTSTGVLSIASPGSDYIASEADTLATVTGRGSTTTNAVSVGTTSTGNLSVTGNVGINTATPDGALTVVPTATSITPLIIRGKTSQVANLLAIASSSATLDVIDTNGYLGIGSTTPSAALDVVGSGKFSNTVTMGTATVSTGNLLVSSGNAGIGTSAPVAKLQIVGSGNCGIGTTAPRQALEVNGTVRAGGYQSSDGTAGATVTTCTGFKNGLCVSGT